MTNDPDDMHDFDAVWRNAVRAAHTMVLLAADLRINQHEAIRRLRSALGTPGERRTAMLILGSLNTSFSRDLVRDIVSIALSHRDALAARQLLGRLSFSEAVQAVPPAVWAQLKETSDDDAYRRMAELLEHLGLREAVHELCRRAAATDDDDIREVALDFGGRMPPD